MKDQIHCPHCQSHKVRRFSKTTQIMLGLSAAIIGVGLLIVAATGVVGYYLFSLPLVAVGSIGAYEEYTNPIVKGHCHDCKKPFEYTLS